jgi:hypothetical protein
MTLHIIELDPADTFVSVRDRLLQARNGRIVLVVPPNGFVLRQGVNLILLRRLADRERLEVGLVTSDRDLAGQARAAGLPAFSNLMVAEHYRPGWWRGRRQRDRLGFAPGGALHLPESQPVSGKSILAAVVGIVGLGLIGLIAALLLFAPQAFVTVRPASLPLQVIVEVAADPFLTQVESDAIPAKQVGRSQVWESIGDSTADEVADQRRMRALALQGLGSTMDNLLAAHVPPGEIFVPGSARFSLVEEELTRQEEGISRLFLRAELSGLAVNHADVDRLIRQRFSTLVPEGYVLDPGTIRYSYEASAEDKESLKLTARAAARATIDPEGLGLAIRGQRTADGVRYLESLPLKDVAQLQIKPAWWAVTFDRLPLMSRRIHVDLLP